MVTAFRLPTWFRFGSAGVTVALALIVMLPAVALDAQDSQLRAERTVAFGTTSALPLKVKVGPITVQSVQFLDRGRPGSFGGVAGLGRATLASDASTAVQIRFAAENPAPEEWGVTFTLEFLDKSGKVIDRVTKRSTWEGEAKTYEFEHPLLQYVMPFIADVRIRFEAKLD